MEVLAVLANVGSIGGRESGIEVGTLDVGGRWWVGAVGTGINSRVSFIVDVERGASGPEAAALSSAVAGVVGGEIFISEVASSGAGSCQVLVGNSVTGWGNSGESGLGVDRVALEGCGGVRVVGDWTAASGLDSTLTGGAEGVSGVEGEARQSPSIDGGEGESADDEC